ncbi:MAG TPA: aminoacyl-tRNA hydrolase [Holophagaceae bacterium]|jgi:PTH1 family peptidyl-tRNA hydrolase|nr:aminoacyl-tRNA hydrolase [Holophagaceae bacterium]
MWTLIPLGNPGEAYAHTRHNLGRLMVLRWMDAAGVAPKVLRKLPSGTLYGLSDRLQALVPATYMNLSGLVCAEGAKAGLDPARFVLLYDDKDLPLGAGRFRLEGSHGGHNGVRSVQEALGEGPMPRLRLGIGPFERPLADFVLGTWTDAEWDRIEALDGPFGRFLELLAGAEDAATLPNQVNAEAFWTSLSR